MVNANDHYEGEGKLILLVAAALMFVLLGLGVCYVAKLHMDNDYAEMHGGEQP